MKTYRCYVDGSYGDTAETHGGVVLRGEQDVCIHVYTTKPEFTSMRNVGGEILAAYTAIKSMSTIVLNKRERGDVDPYTLELVYDYKGIGAWATGEWKTNKAATQWYAKEVKKILREVPNFSVSFVWVHGHTGDVGNELADKVASYDCAYCRAHNITSCCMDSRINI